MKTSKKVRSVKKSPIFDKNEELVENKVKTHLDLNHLRQLDATLAEVAIARSEMLVKEQTVKAMKLEIQIMQHNLVQEMNKLKELSNNYENCKKKSGSLVESMKKAYDITGDFSYDNDSGEIKR